MSTHNICFCGEIRKILCGYPLLSVAMQTCGSYHIYIALDKKGITKICFLLLHKNV